MKLNIAAVDGNNHIMYASAVYAAMRCLTVCLSITFVYCVEINKYILICSLSVSHTILVFHTKRYGNIPTGTP